MLRLALATWAVVVVVGGATSRDASAAAKDYQRCVDAISGEVDMACLGGSPTGTSQLRVDDGWVIGDIPDGVRALYAVLPRMRICHEAAILRGTTGVEGSIKLAAKVNGKGEPFEAHQADVWGITDAKLVDCVVLALGSLHFSPPAQVGRGKVRLTLAFHLRVAPKPAPTHESGLIGDAHRMCGAASVLLKDGWAGRNGVLMHLATDFAASGPSDEGTAIVKGFERLAAPQIPAAWQAALIAHGVAAKDAACGDLERLLAPTP